MMPMRDFSALWDAPYRPLFSAAFLCALLSVAWWPLGVKFGLPAPGFTPAVLWHIHELFFGFAAAAIGGYLLTALPGWTAHPPLQGAGLKALVLVWIFARIATAKFDALPVAIPLFLNAAFFAGLAGVLCHQLAAAGSYRKLCYPAVVLGLGICEAAFLVEAAAGSVWSCLALSRTALAGLILLLFSVGARVIPAFTRNWLAQQGDAGPPVRDAAQLCCLLQGLLLLGLALKPAGFAEAAYATWIAAGAMMLWTMRGWRTGTAFFNPLLAAQHMAFLWLPFGTLAFGVIGLDLIAYQMPSAVHAITIGGMSGLIMAISGRAGCHRPEGIMRAGAGFTAGCLLIWLATWTRLALPFSSAYAESLITAAAVLWCIGWLTFITGFLPALSGPARRPVLSGRSFGQQ
ncbi:NnrS family protein [Leisingera sp. ANG-M7]|uniref:NnrS family protein n=1 Tax=Leisingera sp. ANG-M7 TaxID=1577902 RepID=UPI0009DEA492